MAEVLQIVTTVGTPLALLGLIVAFVYYAYARWLKHVEKKLELLSPEDRAKAVDNYLTRYKVDAKNLTRDQKFQLIQGEMDKRYRLSRLYALVAAVVFIICFVSAALAYALRQTYLPPGEPIRDISVSVSTKLPDSKDQEKYQKRLKTEIEQLLKNPEVFTPDKAMIWSPDNSDPSGKKGILQIGAGAVLFPSPMNEPGLYSEVFSVSVKAWFFRDPAKAKVEKILSPDDGDLQFMVSRGAFDGVGLKGISLDYDVSQETLELSATGLDVQKHAWRTNGKIVTMSDLLDSTLVLQVASNPQPPLNAKNAKIADLGSFVRDLPIITFNLRISNRNFDFQTGDFHRKKLDTGFVYYVLKDKLAKFANRDAEKEK